MGWVSPRKRGNLKKRKRKRVKITFFGHFGTLNFGNESTLQAILYHLRRVLPDAEVACIGSGPVAIAATHGVEAFPMNPIVVKRRNLRNPVGRLLRKGFVGIPREVYRWIDAVQDAQG